VGCTVSRRPKKLIKISFTPLRGAAAA
jgi:hypothetical protein